MAKKADDQQAVLTLLGEVKKPWYKRWWGIGGAVVLVGALGIWIAYPSSKLPVQYVTQKAVQGNLQVTIAADGTLNPTRTVSIGSELSGIVSKVNVDVNDVVKPNQVLIELDKRTLQAQLLVADANVKQAQAKVFESQALLKEAQLKLERYETLNKVSKGRLPTRADLDSQKATVASAQASLKTAQANLASAESNLDICKVDLSKADIVSPIEGVVLARSVEPGYAVAASLQAVELLTLATDLRHLELQVNIDEADVGSVKPGQKAYFTVSSYPDKRFPATLKKIAFGPTTTDNVVTYTAYLDVDNSELLLRPGMTASATIETANVKQALLVPNTALRFKPQASAETSSGGGSSIGFMPPPPTQKRKKAKDVDSNVILSERDGTVYVLKNGQAVPVKVVLGLTNGTSTQVVEGDLSVNDAVITDQRKQVMD